MNVYGLIGFPLSHSFSKKYFTQKFEEEKLTDCSFELFPLNSIREFPVLITTQKDIKGLAVTIPYKEAVLPYLDSVSDEVKKIDAVNCICIIDGKLKGYNTDVTGFERSFKPLLQHHHTKALVLGTGGASKAVQYVLRKLGIPFLIVTRKINAGIDHINYNTIDEKMMANYPVIINCTPVGMYPNEAEAPEIPYQLLNNKNLLYDLVYKPEQTKFLTLGLQQGAAVKNGYEMLLIQAEENFKLWNTASL